MNRAPSVRARTEPVASRLRTFLCPQKPHALSLAALGASLVGLEVVAASSPTRAELSDPNLAQYFKSQTTELARRCLADIRTIEDWNAKKHILRDQLFEMLSLSPLPERTDLKATVTGTLEHESFRVEKLHFQSMPGLYVTANLYLPKKIEKPVPAILYVCGHAQVVKEGISFGNKTAYQHHGAWFARNGYVCLLIDTIQLGEIQGIHHGTYREGMWWWNARGYNSAGVEAWNSIRALDYLQSRPEVDPDRLGVTGRSGGGAYSWWVTALDDRIQAAAPVAGITDLENHVVDGVVEGHCDCMFTVNTYGWDYAQVAALVAPRPLLIANSDKDSIFPLDGVLRIHQQVRRIYDLHNAGSKLGLLITEGPHKDTQDLQVPVFRWFNRHLKGEDPIIEMAATKFFEPQDLRVFSQLPSDERTSKIHESFVAKAAVPTVPQSAAHWIRTRDAWQTALRQKVFAGWPAVSGRMDVQQAFSAEAGGLRLGGYDFNSQSHVPLRLHILRPAKGAAIQEVNLEVCDARAWQDVSKLLRPTFGKSVPALDEDQLSTSRRAATGDENDALRELGQTLLQNKRAIVYFAPRLVAGSGAENNEKKQIQIRRRFMLLGQTVDGMRVWDIRRAIQAVRSMEDFRGLPLTVLSGRQMGVNVLYAAVFEDGIAAVELSEIPLSHRPGPDYLNVLRVLDVPQAAAMAMERTRVRIVRTNPAEWEFASGVAALLGRQHQFQVVAANEAQVK